MLNWDVIRESGNSVFMGSGNLFWVVGKQHGLGGPGLGFGMPK